MWKISRFIDKEVDEIKIRSRGFHGFRRSFADRLFNSGFDIPEIQEAMQHHTKHNYGTL